MQPLTNSYLGQYQLIEVIGRGSMSTVYKAYQPSLNRYVGIKVLLRHLDPPFASRFKREAQAIAQLQHPNILPIYDYGEHDGILYFVTPYIENGVTLGDLMAQYILEDIQAMKLIELLLGALESAHRRGIIHRDIKPSNVLMAQPNWPLLADFGIARLMDDSHGLTPPGQALGTASYMAPERAMAQEADQRSDLYSMGVMLYEMVTGQVPFDGLTPIATLLKHVHEPPPPPRSLRPDLPEQLEIFLLQALEKDPDARYQTAGHMVQDLRRIRTGIMRDRTLRTLIDPPQEDESDPYRTDEIPTLPITAPSVVLPTINHVVPRLREPTPTYTAATVGLHPDRIRQFNRFAFIFLALAVLIAAVMLSSALPTLISRSQPAATRDATSTLPLGTPTPEIAAQPGVVAVIDTPFPVTEPPLAPTEELPLPTFEASAFPATNEPGAPTVPATPPPAPVSTPQIVETDGQSSIRLEDSDWSGGFRTAEGRTYGSRSATWIYGIGTEYSVMQAMFALSSQPQGTAQLTIEGMDSENAPRTQIRITVNDVQIFQGSNPLPDDDHPIESGTWASYTWSFDAILLQPGENTIKIENLDQGQFSRPPFFMLDYAVVDLTLPDA